LAAWNFKVGSGIFTGIDKDNFRRDYNVPHELNISAVIGFGYPARKLTGKRKDRRPLGSLFILKSMAFQINHSIQL